MLFQHFFKNWAGPVRVLIGKTNSSTIYPLKYIHHVAYAMTENESDETALSMVKLYSVYLSSCFKF